jgi:hypothetical protein
VEQIHACHAGGLPELVDDAEDEEEEEEDDLEGSKNLQFTETVENLLGKNMQYAEVENGDRIFMAHIHPERQEHIVWATSTISQQLAEAFSKNSKKPTFRDLVPESLHDFEDSFNKESFDTLLEQ